jgi:hypothetical protein
VEHDTPSTVDIGFEDGSHVEATPVHPFFVPEANGFVPAGELHGGSVVGLLGGGRLRVEGVTTSLRSRWVFNLEVEAAESYGVGLWDVWVHNQCGARFIGQPDGTLVDTQATPPGSYDQPGVVVANGVASPRTDVLQGADHGAGLSHTHDPVLHTRPGDGRVFQGGHDSGRPVTFEEAQNIASGAATRSAPRGR